MGNGSITKLSNEDFISLKTEYERMKEGNSSDVDIFSRLSDVIDVIESKNVKRLQTCKECKLTIVSVNDVYELDLLPNFASCRDSESLCDTGKVIAVLAGDFVAPSLLSSLDKGFAMVDCMNKIGINYVCIGNHEADVTISQLHDRIRQSNFTWINSNMQSLPLPEDMGYLPEYVVVEVEGGGQVRRIALLGLNTDDPSLYRPGAFGGCTIDPILPKAKELYASILAKENVDAIIPLTHQSMPYDRELADTKLFPLIIGGHDHELFLEVINGCTIVKSGTEAQQIAVSTITWPTADCRVPLVDVSIKHAKDFIPKTEVLEVVNEHKKQLKEVEISSLCKIPNGLELSSVGMRLHPTTVGTFICSTVRDALGTMVTLLPAGIIRANRSYENEKSFTYAHLKAELPFDSFITTLTLPGRVICDMITYSREFAHHSPPVEKGGFLQTDDGVEWNEITNTVTKLASRPVEMDGTYIVAVNLAMLSGMDDIVPLLKYKEMCAFEDPNVNKMEDCGIPVKHIVVSHFSKILLYQIVSTEKFEDIDTNGDGTISFEELQAIALKKFGPDGGMSRLTLHNLFNIADTNKSGTICLGELTRVFMSSLTSMRRLSSTEEELLSVHEVVDMLRREMCGIADEAALLLEVRKIDTDQSGFITRSEYAAFKKDASSVSTQDVVI